MKPYVDHILCILPFEPAELAAPRRSARHLRRPPADRRSGRACGRGSAGRPRDLSADREKTLLLLPGSRKGEVSRLIGPFGETVASLRRAGTGCGSSCRPSRMSPTSSRRRCRAGSRGPRSCSDAAGKWQAFGEADAALIASGTVSLELALPACRSSPATSSTRSRALIQNFITVWSALLPNLIADRPIVAGGLQPVRAAAEPGAPSSNSCSPTPSCAPGRRKALPKSRAAWRRTAFGRDRGRDRDEGNRQ